MAIERTARVVDIVEHSEDTRSIFLAPDDQGPLDFRPGQFISCLLPHRDQILQDLEHEKKIRGLIRIVVPD